MARLLMLLLIGAFIGAGYWLSTSQRVDPGPLGEMRARFGSLIFEVVESKVVTLGGMERFEVTLALVRGQSQTVEAEKLVVSVCGSILSAKAALDQRGYARERVFEVAVQVLLKDGPIFDAPIPVSVRDSECRPSTWNDQFFRRYPPPIDDFILFDMTAEEGTATVTFRVMAEANPDLDAFDFLTACRYLMQDPPRQWATIAAKTPNKIVIEAKKYWGNSLLNAWSGRTQEFVLSGQECIVATGEPA